MKRKLARSEHSAAVPMRRLSQDEASSARSRASGSPAAARVDAEPGSPHAPGRARVEKPRRGSTVRRLAAEVERLTAELDATRAQVAALEARADIDPLTDTFNRRGFERELKRSLAYVKRYGVSAALLYLDLDDFKPVNDRHGHAAGDAVLKAVAATLVHRVRASDVVARIGGDEFAVLLWNITGAQAKARANALETAVYGTQVTWGASTLVVGLSAGVALLGALDSPAEVIARADAAMYARKAERRAYSEPTQ